MNARLWVASIAACAALAACDGGSTFSDAVGRNGGTNGGTGTISGTVTANGAGQGGISVVLVGRDSTVTGTGGAFTFASVPTGTYQVSVRVPLGYTLAAGATATRSVSLGTGGSATLTFTLQSTTTVAQRFAPPPEPAAQP